MKCRNCLGKKGGCVVCLYTGKHLVGGFIKQNERYTPPDILDAVRRVYLGQIDFDPASCELANHLGVHATTYYDYKQNGLKQEWKGKGWCNPPYGRAQDSVKGLQALFMEKGLYHYYNGSVSEMMFLFSGNAPYRSWFVPLRGFPMCMYMGDVRFYCPTDKQYYENPYGSVIVYLGRNIDSFYNEFNKFGNIVIGYKPLVTRLPLDNSDLTLTRLDGIL